MLINKGSTSGSHLLTGFQKRHLILTLIYQILEKLLIFLIYNKFNWNITKSFYNPHYSYEKNY